MVACPVPDLLVLLVAASGRAALRYPRMSAHFFSVHCLCLLLVKKRRTAGEGISCLFMEMRVFLGTGSMRSVSKGADE